MPLNKNLPQLEIQDSYRRHFTVFVIGIEYEYEYNSRLETKMGKAVLFLVLEDLEIYICSSAGYLFSGLPLSDLGKELKPGSPVSSVSCCNPLKSFGV